VRSKDEVVVDNSVVNIHLPSKDEHGKNKIRGKDEFGGSGKTRI
jgi:hypothetical protein